MIKQRITITKTATDTLTVAEMGDIICNSANAQTYTLPAVSKGLWYRLTNINTGVVTVSNGGTIATLAQYEQCLVINNGTTWYATETHSVLTSFAAITSAQLAALISDETGTGVVVFSGSPVLTTPNIGSATGDISGNAATVTTNANLTGAITSVGNATKINPRVVSAASVATLTIDDDSYDVAILTAQAAALTIAAPTGTPVSEQELMIRIKDNGTTRALTWNAAFVVEGVTLPTDTTAGKWHRISCMWCSTDNKWKVIVVGVQA